MTELLSNISWEFLLFVLIVLIWSVIILYLDRKKILKRYNMDRIWFIALMWRTKKGRKLIDKIASKKRMWMGISTGGFIFFFTGMVLMFLMVMLSAFVASTNPQVKPAAASDILVLPGINPYVPFIYGIIGLVVAVVAHEFSHGIIARVMDFKVKAMGLLFIIIPIGAFMEPDEKEVEKGSRIARMRMFSAGPVMNFILAFLFLSIFSGILMASIEAEDSPLIITDISIDSPIHLSLDDHPKALYRINTTDISSSIDLYDYDESQPGDWLDLEMKMNGDHTIIPMKAGVMITGVGKDTPAEKAGIIEGSIIHSLNGTVIMNSRTFSDMMGETLEGQTILLTLLVPESDDEKIILSVDPPVLANQEIDIYEGIGKFPVYKEKTINVTLDNKYDYYRIKEFQGKGYIGITSSYLGISGIGSEDFKETLHRPLGSQDSLGGKFYNIVYITFRLPMELEKMPFHDPLTDIYDLKGPLSILPEPAFWFIANTVFYIFWLNILLGLFNALPMVPLDGGFVFRDAMVIFLEKITGLFDRIFPEGRFKIIKDRSEENLEKIAKKISVTASFLVLGLILLSVLGPRLQFLFLS